MDALVLALIEADSVSGRVAHDSSLSVSHHLASLLVILELVRLGLVILDISEGALSNLALLREHPGQGRSGIENYLHFLGGVAEPEESFVAHILSIQHIYPFQSWGLVFLDEGFVGEVRS